jgi:hypothetical protein
MKTETLDQLRAERDAARAERDSLIKRHRAVCKACALLDTKPQATIDDFLETYSAKKPK